MGSSKAGLNERAVKLLMSALKLVVEGSRSIRGWVKHLNTYLNGELPCPALSGHDDDWRIADSLLADCIRMAHLCQENLQAWVNHLQAFIFDRCLKALVNYDDPAHRSIDPKQYAYVDPSLSPEHFPVRGKGQAEVIFKYLEFDHEATTEEVLHTIAGRSDVRRPDKAETDSYLKANPQEPQEAPVISLCGAIEGRGCERRVACAYAGLDGVSLPWYWLSFRWGQRCRFLVVCK